ncbi:MAG TPA: FHA domain-containing protein [Steroidobacteraceae bacterium]|nr:FHA domain-containing protein [Steroidobacteraceae bacterium]
MEPFVLEPDDRAFALARAGGVLESSPSAVSDGSAGGAIGADAWHAVRRLPTSTSTRHLASVLRDAQPSAQALALCSAEIARRLRGHALTPGQRVWIASPAYAGAAGLGALLGITSQLGLPVDGFIDAAVASSAALELPGPAIVIELGLHHLAATLVERDAGPVSRRRALLSERRGLLELYQAWLDFINTQLVRQTRFDALHDALTEQQLFDLLPSLAHEAAAQGVATATLTAGETRVAVPLTRDQLAQVAQPLWDEIVRLVHELRPAGTALALLIPETLAGLPGLLESLTPFAGCELVSLPGGFAAAAVSLLELPLRQGGETVRLLRRLPGGAQPRALAAQVRRTRLGEADDVLAPSHLLFEGRTFALGSEPLVVGRGAGGGAAITLAEGLAGVSRRHCTLMREGAQVVLLDHSRFGTFVNGERVAERVRVRAGDEVRVGDPGVALALIAVNPAVRG